MDDPELRELYVKDRQRRREAARTSDEYVK